jgi:hypothetical protein
MSLLAPVYFLATTVAGTWFAKRTFELLEPAVASDTILITPCAVGLGCVAGLMWPITVPFAYFQ